MVQRGLVLVRWVLQPNSGIVDLRLSRLRLEVETVLVVPYCRSSVLRPKMEQGFIGSETCATT